MAKKDVSNYNLTSNSGSSLKKKKKRNPLANLGVAVTATVFVVACVFEIISFPSAYLLAFIYSDGAVYTLFAGGTLFVGYRRA